MILSPARTSDDFDFLGIVEKPKTGVTFKVRNRVTEEIEVLRALPGAAAGDPETRERFLREIRVHTRLAHPNIAAFHDAFELDGQIVMTSEYVDGTSLAQLCFQGPLSAGESCRIVSEILCALEEAHALGIVHRAITANNIRIDRAGRTKLDGFGLAKPSDDINLTQTGSVLGDARYISPEQVMGVQPLDPRSDLYSMGIVLYEALTGRVPFRGSNDFDVMVAQVGATPEPPSHFNSSIPPEMDELVLKAIAKQAADRFANARAFRDALAPYVVVLPPPTVEPAAAAPSAPASVAAAPSASAPANRRPSLPPPPPRQTPELSEPSPISLRFYRPHLVAGTIILSVILAICLYVQLQ